MNDELKSLRLIDWDFPTRTSQVLMHDLCWYPARFVPAIPSHLIEALSAPGELVCDPFCGSGTTLVEALLLGRRAWGIDINPFGVLIATSKCLIARKPKLLRSDEMGRFLSTLGYLVKKSEAGGEVVGGRIKRLVQGDLFPNIGSRSHNHGPIDRSELKKWFHPNTLHQLTTIFSMIEEVDNDDLKKVITTIFIGILMPASSHEGRKPYGYFADNVVPKTMRYRNAYRLLFVKCRRLIIRVENSPLIKAGLTADAVRISHTDASDPRVWRGKEVDCVVTSPPYPGAVDYAMAFRLASYWFPGLGDIVQMRAEEIGARGLRRRSDAREQYFTSMQEVFQNVVSGLRRGGALALVLPKGRTQTPTIDRLVRSVSGIECLTQVAKLERRILKRYFIREGGGIRSEVVLVFRKVRV